MCQRSTAKHSSSPEQVRCTVGWRGSGAIRLNAISHPGEKGNVSPQIEVRTEGGHSSIPRPHTAIGLLSRIVASIESVPHWPRCISSS